MKKEAEISFFPLAGIPMVQAGDDLCALIETALEKSGLLIQDGDILVVAQKVVSKSEGRAVTLADIVPGEKAKLLAVEVDKDPRLVELILRESTGIVRFAPGALIVRHRLGIVCANAGIDQSNLEHDAGERALLLPENPDRSAREIAASLELRAGKRVGVIISDSINRPWRLGTIGIAIGCSGVQVLDDRRGETDLFGRTLKVTMSNHADAIASAATLLMGETRERIPAVLVRGARFHHPDHCAAMANRPLEDDLFK